MTETVIDIAPLPVSPLTSAADTPSEAELSTRDKIEYDKRSLFKMSYFHLRGLRFIWYFSV